METEVAKTLHFIGRAKINLTAFDFSICLKNSHRQVSPRKVERLLSIFETEGCLRFNPSNYIHAVIDETELNNALHRTSISLRTLDPSGDTLIPLLRARVIHCLDGLHRIRAAESYLEDDELWWIVKLYHQSISPCP